MFKMKTNIFMFLLNLQNPLEAIRTSWTHSRTHQNLGWDSQEKRVGRPPRPHCFTLRPWNRPKLSGPTNFSSSGPVALTSSAPVRHSTEPWTQKGRPVATAAIRAQDRLTNPAQQNRTRFCRSGMMMVRMMMVRMMMPPGPGPGSGPYGS